MNTRAFFLSLVLGLLSTGWLHAETFSVPDTTVTFDAPDGFTTLSPAELAQKFPSGRRPQFAVGDARRGTTVAYELKPDRISPEELEKVKAEFERVFERAIPGLEWRERKLIELAGQRWILLEMLSKVHGADIHNLMLVTPYREKMLVFNFNSTTEAFPGVEAALRQSIASIRLR